jgi:hypothetical protein
VQKELRGYTCVAKTKRRDNELSPTSPQGSDCAENLVESATKLRVLEETNADLRRELSECKNAADLVKPLLTTGLRLAFANEALHLENSNLRKEAAKAVGNAAPKKASTGAV